MLTSPKGQVNSPAPPPRRPARLVDVAREAGVSRPVAAAVLTGAGGNTRVGKATAERVRKIAAAMKFRPNMIARQLRGKRSGLLGVLIGADNAQVNFDRVSHLEREAFARGLRCLVGQFHDDYRQAADYAGDLAARGVDGLIWIHQPLGPAAALGEHTLSPVEHVVFLDHGPSETDACVRIDYAAGIRALVTHLVGRGRQRIALVLAGRGFAGDPLAERRRGYAEGLAACGRGVREELVWYGDLKPEPTAEQLEAILAEVVGRGGADAVLASNDVWAAALIRRLHRQGRRVPDDVAVAGFDNLSLAALYDPALTTVDQNHSAFARAALDLVQRRIARQEGPAVAMVTPLVVVRESA